MARRIVDLTQTLYQGIRGLETEQKSTIADVGCNTTTLHLYSHAGTHMDAPLHFVDGGDTIDNVLLERCIGPAAVFDLTHKGPNTSITIEDMLPYADRIHPGARVILRTDWSLHAEMEDYRPDQPRISPELASWFVERQIALIGVEPASVASLRSDTGDEITVVHQILLKAGIVVVEGLANLRELRQDEIEFIVLPLKIRGCDGSPVRAIAIETVSSEEEALPALEPWQSPETKVTLAAAQIACVSDSGDNIKLDFGPYAAFGYPNSTSRSRISGVNWMMSSPFVEIT